MTDSHTVTEENHHIQLMEKLFTIIFVVSACDIYLAIDNAR